MASEKVIRFTRCKETAADIHWCEIDAAVRTWAHMATLMYAAIPGNEDEHSAELNDIAKTLCKALINNAAGIANLQRDLITWGWSTSFDDGIETLARVSANLLKSREWAMTIPPNFTDELRRLAGVIASTAQARRMARQEVMQEQRQAV